MGKQKGFRKIQGVPKKNEKRVVNVSKLPANLQVGSNIKNIERLIEEEIEFAFWRKKMDKSFRKELERYSLLAKAVHLGCERAVDDLLDAGVNVNEQIMDGSTPILIAVDKGHTTILQKLLKAGADLRLSRNNGMNAFMIAVSKNDDKAFFLLWNHFDKKDNWILNQENSFEFQDGYTILMIAVERGFVEFAKFFSSLGVGKVDHQTKDGRSALMLAAMRSQPEIVKSLLECNASVLLEDKAGCTALCVALAQEQPDIVEMLLETLNKKDREVYVKKRVELLAKPRQYSPFEITNTYKKILFRVILEIKKMMENGSELLIKYKVYFALMRCIESNQSDPDLLWQAFHLAACLMYDNIPDTAIILKDLADQFIDSNGPEISLKIMTCSLYKNNSDIKEATFIPIQASVMCPSGKSWLKEHCCQIQKFATEFKSNLPFMKFWVKEEILQTKMIFKQFEEEMLSIGFGKENSNCVPNEALPIANRKPLDNFECSFLDTESINGDSENQLSFAEAKQPRESNPVASSGVNIRAAKKNEVPRKVKNIKFHAKFDKKSKMKTDFHMKDINFSLNKNFSRRMNALESSSQTGYADALKRNLNCKTEDEYKLEHLATESNESSLQEVNVSNDSLLSVKSAYRVKQIPQKDMTTRHSASTNSTQDISDKLVDSFKSYASVAGQKNDINVSINKTENIYREDIEKPTKLNDIYSIWNKVREPCKLLSFITKFYPSSNKQKLSPENMPEKEKPISHPSEILLNKEEELDSEAQTSYFAKDTNLKEDYNFFKECNKKFESCPVKPEARQEFVEEYPTDCSPDFQTKLKRMDLEAENLYCLLESLDVKEQYLINSNDNCQKEEMSIANDIGQQKSAIGKQEFCKEEVEVKLAYDADDSFNNVRTKYHSNNLNMNEANYRTDSRNVVRRTYCDVARTNVRQTTENIKSYPADRIDGTQESIQYSNALPQFEHFGDVNISIPERLECENGYEQIESQLTSAEPDSKSEKENTSAEIFSGNAGSKKSGNSILFEERSKQLEKDVSVEKERVEAERAELDEQILQCNESNFNSFGKYEMDNDTSRGEKSREKDEKLLINNSGNEILHSYKLKCLESIRKRVISLEDLNIPPITCQLKLLSLQKYLALYQRLIYYNLQCRGFKNLSQSKMDFDVLINNPEPIFGKSLKKKITVFTENHQSPSTVTEMRYNNTAETKLHPEEPKFINFINNLSKTVALKIPKNNNESKAVSFSLWNNSEYRRKTARDQVLKKRRDLMSKGQFEYRNDKDEVTFLRSGYISSFINCEVGSKWFSALKSLQYCVPLSQHILDPCASVVEDTSKSSHIHQLDSCIGEIVFCTKTELTLREGAFGTYIGLNTRDGTPICIRQFATSSFVADRAALSLSRRRLLKHERLAIFYVSLLTLSSFAISLSLPYHILSS
ncbi:uncharacterized protein TNCT_213651 [Trichonephila clavata]|uniref:Ankyrin repeat protein n=1 Tax=Trichonephila clavata TaxID=2740835 RepID=A0A8X6GG03_TRICU|nr:uncharacterized protein TNCT_213651 [Trichonephila clavata]